MRPAYLLKKYREKINPPYHNKSDLIVLIGTIFILVAIPLTTIAVQRSREPAGIAAAVGTLYLSPDSLSVNQGSNITVQVREESGTQTINAVQANLTYDDTKLDFVSITSSPAFTIEAESIGGGGSVMIGRAVEAGQPPLTGDQLVATITFSTKNTPGSTPINFATGSAIVSSVGNTNIMTSTSGGSYTIVDPPPTISITNPANNAEISGTVTVSANASDDIGINKVEFSIDGGATVSTDTTAPYSFSWDTTTVSNATHTLSATAFDSGSNTTTDTITVIVDNQAPTVSITSPTNNSVVSGTISVNATASDNRAVTKVEFSVDSGAPIATDTTAPYSFNWNTSSVSSGAHILEAKAFDAVGNNTTSSINVTVDNSPPSAPSGLSAQSVSDSQINLSWNASTDDIGVVGYDIYRNGTVITTIASTSYDDTGLTIGVPYTYFVKAKDGQGNVSGSSNSITVFTLKLGDLNQDGRVDIFDLSLLLGRWRTADPVADINGDGEVNIFDLSILLSNWDG